MFRWEYDLELINYDVLSNLYRIAPLGIKSPERLKCTYGNSLYKCFVYDGEVLIGAGRVLGDGMDCAYLCDIAVHPDYHGKGVGKAIVTYLLDKSQGHHKVILYANPGKEAFYEKFGFKMMTTAMAIFADEEVAIEKGILKA